MQKQKLKELQNKLDEVEDVFKEMPLAQRETVVTAIGYYMNQIEKFGRPSEN